MDTQKELPKRVEDLPVDGKQADDVTGGQDFHKTVVDPSYKGVVDTNISAFSWGMK